MEDELQRLVLKCSEPSEEDRKIFVESRIRELECPYPSRSSNAALLAEFDMLQRFISRLDPKDLVSKAADESLGEAGGHQLEGRSCGWRLKSRPSKSDQPKQLTPAQKLYIARREVEETQKDHESLRKRYQNIQDSYQAIMEEAETRLAEIGKARKKFEHRVLEPMKNKRVDTKDPEKVLEHIVDKSKKDQVEMLRLRIQSLKVKERRLQQQLQHMTEVDDAEYKDVYFEVNEQGDDRNLHDLRLKSLKAQRLLNFHKEKLDKVTRESEELSNIIKKQQQLLGKIEKELQHAEEERLKAEALNQQLRCQKADYHAPDIPEYMDIKDKHKQLQRRVPIWERKLRITEASSKQRAAHTPVNRGSTSE